jgi:kinesin family member 6/9
LRDSLGGNCNTKMIATISALKEDIHESLGTMRFARSVSMVQNDMKKNERVEPGVIISRLKKEVAELKAELSLAKGGNHKESLDPEDIERCNLMVNNFIKTNEENTTLVLPDRLLINQCFYYFKQLYRNLEKGKGGVAGSSIPQIQSSAQSSNGKSGTKAIEAGPEDKAAMKDKEIEVNRLNMLVK